jgi:zinc/manganese transport system substrate-binding protein
VLAVLAAVSGTLLGIHYVAPAGTSNTGGARLPVVAAENFWGSLVGQLGGSHVSVLSIVSDPNADPHEYETNTSDAVAIADAKLVIENGAGYDAWCAQLIASSNTPGQLVLNVASLLSMPTGANPHFWYGQLYVRTAVAAMYSDLVRLDPADQAYFRAQYGALNQSLAPVWAQESTIDANWGLLQPNVSARAQVASTESIFVYLANSTGLDLVSPYDFMKAVSEGIDPPSQSIATFQEQLQSGNVSVLVVNEQTVTPLTQQMSVLASQHNVSVVGITETIQPPGQSFAAWMFSELSALETALGKRGASG